MPRLLVGFLTVVGALALFVVAGAIALRFFFSSGSDISVEQTLLAPDASHTATLYTSMGGGAAGWCSRVISINPASAPFSAASERDSMSSQVYTGNCSVTPQVAWLSPSSLQITLPEFVRRDWVSASLRGADESGRVTVTYVFTHNKVLQPTVPAPACISSTPCTCLGAAELDR